MIYRKILVFLITFLFLTSKSNSFENLDHFYSAIENFTSSQSTFTYIYKKHFKKAEFWKAIAATREKDSQFINWADLRWGYSYGFRKMKDAKEMALAECNKKKRENQECIIIIENNKLVYEDSFIKEIRNEFYNPSDSPGFNKLGDFFMAVDNFYVKGSGYDSFYPKYRNINHNKALAFSRPKGSEHWDPAHPFTFVWSLSHDTLKKAREDALFQCNSHENKLENDECFIFAENNKLVYEDELIERLAEEYYNLSNVNVKTDYIGYSITHSQGLHFNIPNSKFYKIIESNGYKGFILKYHNEKKTHTIDVKLPKNSPPIISDYQSIYGVLGGDRGGTGSHAVMHPSVDFYVKPGEPLLAAHDGQVVMMNNDLNAHCAGRILGIKINSNLFSNYAHIGKIYVKLGDKVKRGQMVAESGYPVGTKCGGGIEHLDFSISSLGPGSCQACEYLDHQVTQMGYQVENPHKFWSGGKGRPECFIPGKEYTKNKLSLPVKCSN